MAHGCEHFIRFRSSKLRQSVSSQVTAMSPLVDQLMMLIRNCRKEMEANSKLRRQCERPFLTQ